MKKIFTLALFILTISTTFGQKLDYDNDTKWFFGFNIGGAWNTTDVKNKTNVGWGLTLGRAFNYNYGKKISFDLRLRYLGGNWYGQDFDTTNVTGNTAYDPNGSVAQTYDTLGYTINNFNNEVHEAGLELVLHLNSLRERTGFDPYIFGGVGIAWNQTYGDLVYTDTINNIASAYPYGVGGASKQELSALTDNVYDTPLDGSSGKKNINFIPSVGIGLAYQVGPKFSIGLEHRTMFYLENTFDGYAGTSSKWGLKNDLYHYSGLRLKFHLGRRKTGTNTNTTVTNPPNNNSGAVTPVDACDNPKVNITRPSGRTITVYDRQYRLEAKVGRVAGRDNISFEFNGSISTNFNFNVSNGKLESTLMLNPGSNTVTLRASNACGEDMETVTINYVDCLEPKVRFTNPATANSSVDRAQYAIRALIENADNIEYQVNGMNSSNFIYNASSGQFESSIVLQEGVNTIRITGRSNCGTDTKLVQIQYTNCIAPYITLLGHSAVTTVSHNRFTVNAEVGSVPSKSNIQFLVNGVSTTFNYATGSKKLNAVVNLKPGENLIQIMASNECGSMQEVIKVNLQDCDNPKVTFISPTRPIATFESTYAIRVKLEHVTSANQIALKVNNQIVSGGSFNPSTKIFEQTVTLSNGANTITIGATNACGTSEASVVVNKKDCPSPKVTLIHPTRTLTTFNSTENIKVKVENAMVSQIQLLVNNNVVTGGTYNPVTQLFQHTIPLNIGTNTVVVKVNTECGQDQKQFSIVRKKCSAPVISMINPSEPTMASEEESLIVKASILNITSAGQVELKVNGRIVPGGTYNSSTHLFQKSIKLASGANTIELIVTNDCSSLKETFMVKYSPCVLPDISMISPMRSFVKTDNGVYTFKASITNIMSASNIKLFVNGQEKPRGTYNATTSIYENTIRLTEGKNNLKLVVTNDCGESVENMVIEFAPCKSPTVALIKPLKPTVSSTTGMISLVALIEHVSNAKNITLSLNGKQVLGGSYNASTKQFRHTLKLTQAGTNTVKIVAKTECGKAEASFIVKYAPPCIQPTVAFVQPTSATTSTPKVKVTALVTEVTNVNQIQFYLNSTLMSGGNYNASTKQFEIFASLKEGKNVIKIQAVNSCGRAVKSKEITFKVQNTGTNAGTGNTNHSGTGIVNDGDRDKNKNEGETVTKPGTDKEKKEIGTSRPKEKGGGK